MTKNKTQWGGFSLVRLQINLVLVIQFILYSSKKKYIYIYIKKLINTNEKYLINNLKQKY